VTGLGTMRMRWWTMSWRRCRLRGREFTDPRGSCAFPSVIVFG
jgi:hypothetical protein